MSVLDSLDLNYLFLQAFAVIAPLSKKAAIVIFVIGGLVSAVVGFVKGWRSRR